MWNPHPPLSGFPFVLVTLLLAAELCPFFGMTEQTRSRIVSFLLVSAAILIPTTYFSGYFGADHASTLYQVPEEAVLQHQLWGKSALFLFLGTALVFLLTHAVRPDNFSLQKKLSALYRVLIVLLALVLVRASYLGGELVFSHGAGLKERPVPIEDVEKTAKTE